MSQTKKRPRLHDENEPSSRIKRVAADDDSSSDENEIGNERSADLSCLPKSVLRKIFSFAAHAQLALQLPLVCQKWYQVACYSDSLWENLAIWLNKQSTTCNIETDEELESVFGQQFLDGMQPVIERRIQSLLFGTFTITTNTLRSLRHMKPSVARRNFIAAYRRHICCDIFFSEMELEQIPPTNSETKALLDSFSKKFNIRLPLGFATLLQRHKIHRYIPHLLYANLKYDDLDFIELPSNRILLLWMKDSQDCWCGFILFDRYNPDPDPPVYSEPDGIDSSSNFFSYLRLYKKKGDSKGSMERVQAAVLVESQLVMENSRLSNFLEQYATQAKHWDMDHANSSDSS